MNFYKSTLTIAFVCLLFANCKEKTTESIAISATENSVLKEKKKITPEKIQTASFTIKGMSCAIGCAKTIEEKLNNLEEVQTAAVNFDTETATVSFDKTVWSPEKLARIIEAAADGKTYKVSNIETNQ